jgi:hypothetical protein
VKAAGSQAVRRGPAGVRARALRPPRSPGRTSP